LYIQAVVNRIAYFLPKEFELNGNCVSAIDMFSHALFYFAIMADRLNYKYVPGLV